MELMNKNRFDSLPKKDKVILFLNEVRNYLFPGYFEEIGDSIEEYKVVKNELLKTMFLTYVINDEAKLNNFMLKLNRIKLVLKTDMEMTYMSDPACESLDEIIISYPGFYAISVYRIANILYELKIPIIPRILSEYAHSITGIDIHPGATIDKYFFIDHGTGIVIGETAIIGHHVKIYHGVTLGALSLRKGQELRGSKRHPTIGNYVTIYSGACVLGGNTIIGDNSTLGCNVFLTESIKENSKVSIQVKID